MKVLLVGLGFFSQNCHLKILRSNKSIKKIYVFDERSTLVKNIAKKFNVSIIKKKDFKNLKKKIDFAIVSTDRSLTYKYSRFILSKNINLLSEKPMAFNHIYSKRLHDLSKKKGVVYEVGFQKNHDANFKVLKNNLNKLSQKYGKLKKVSFELYGGDFRRNYKTIVRTDENLKTNKFILPKFLRKKFNINYIVFCNRYLHSLFLFFDLFNIKKIKNFKEVKFNIYNIYNYKLNFLYNNKNILFKFGNYKSTGWHDRVFLDFEKMNLKLSFKSPLLFKPSHIYVKKNKNKFIKRLLNIKKDSSNQFEEQLKCFIYKIKHEKKGNSFLSLITHKFTDNLWKLTNDKK